MQQCLVHLTQLPSILPLNLCIYLYFLLFHVFYIPFFPNILVSSSQFFWLVSATRLWSVSRSCLYISLISFLVILVSWTIFLFPLLEPCIHFHCIFYQVQIDLPLIYRSLLPQHGGHLVHIFHVLVIVIRGWHVPRWIVLRNVNLAFTFTIVTLKRKNQLGMLVCYLSHPNKLKLLSWMFLI